MEFLYFAHLGFSLCAVVPEIGHMRAQFLLLHLDFLRFDVKVMAE